MSLTVSRESAPLQRLLLTSDQQKIKYVEIFQGQCFKAKLHDDVEETAVIMKGMARMKIGGEIKTVTPISLVKMTANKVHKFYNDQTETVGLYLIKAKINLEERQNGDEGLYIRKKEDCYEIVATEQERIYELFGKTNGNAEMHSVALVDIHEGGSSARHYHPVVNETYVIDQGEGRLVIDSKESIVKAGDTIVIPVGKNHQIFNASSQTLKLVVVVTPPWTMDCGVYN